MAMDNVAQLMRSGFLVLKFTGERIVPGADNCEPTFAQKMYQEHIARYAFAAQFAPEADILDVGCGVGYGSQWLAKAGAASVLGIDIAPDSIDHARKNYFHSVTTYRTLDASEIDLESEVDLVTCFELIEHVHEQEKVLDGIKRALRDDGILVISTPRPLDDIRTHYHVHELSFEELRNSLKRRFKFVEAYFERNYFTSFVGASKPKIIENLVPLTDQFEIENADYFIFVASDEKPERFQNARDMLSMNDDSYVLNLENDVSVLRNAENNHLDRIRDLEVQFAEMERLRQAHIENMQKLAEAETAAFSFREENVRLREISSSIDALNTELNAVRYRLDYAETTLARFRSSLSWYVTRPLRWIGRMFNKLMGRQT